MYIVLCILSFAIGIVFIGAIASIFEILGTPILETVSDIIKIKKELIIEQIKKEIKLYKE